MISIQIDSEFKGKLSSKKIGKAAQAVLDHHKRHAASMAVAVGGDEKIQSLNLEYRGIDKPTDVLSFPSGEPDPQTGRVYLGDIIISYPTAEKQAETSGHPVIDEIMLLVVHGVLHLFGHDHREPDDKKEMWAIQDEILSKLKVKARPHD